MRRVEPAAYLYAIVKRIRKYPFVEAKYSSKRANVVVDTIVVHYTAGRGNEDVVARFFASGRRRASAHFCIGRTGNVIQTVDLERAAWHAGKSSFLNVQGVNQRSIGIELCNRGWAGVDKLTKDEQFHGRHRNPASRSTMWEKFPWIQIEALDRLLRELKDAIPSLRYITGHEDIRNTRVVNVKGSKTDPGPAFPWHVLDLAACDLEQWHYSFRDDDWYFVASGERPTH